MPFSAGVRTADCCTGVFFAAFTWEASAIFVGGTRGGGGGAGVLRLTRLAPFEAPATLGFLGESNIGVCSELGGGGGAAGALENKFNGGTARGTGDLRAAPSLLGVGWICFAKLRTFGRVVQVFVNKLVLRMWFCVECVTVNFGSRAATVKSRKSLAVLVERFTRGYLMATPFLC